VDLQVDGGVQNDAQDFHDAVDPEPDWLAVL
jgi:hypothetical protein